MNNANRVGEVLVEVLSFLGEVPVQVQVQVQVGVFITIRTYIDRGSQA